jgi:acyl dehydratase
VNQPLSRAHEAAQARVGQTTWASLGRMSAREFQRFAIACGETNPVYYDDVAARSAGFPAAIAPPLYLSSVTNWGAGPSLSELRQDGSGHSDTRDLPLDGLRLMGCGQELEFHAPVTDGTEVSVESYLSSAELKEGTSGPLLILKTTRRYLDSSGSPVAVCTETVIARPRT